jgi:hypothetical protein
MAILPVRATPRLSATQLADYLVTPTPIGQRGILRQAKYPVQSKPLIIQYQHARRCIAACLQSPVESPKIIGAAFAMLEQKKADPSSAPLTKDDASRSIDVIDAFATSINKLKFDGYFYDASNTHDAIINISGVDISVAPDAIAWTNLKDGKRIGSIFIKCTLGVLGEAAEARRTASNTHLATIAHMHALKKLATIGTPYPPASMVIDVTRETAVRGTPNMKKRIENMEAACEVIEAVWPKI